MKWQYVDSTIVALQQFIRLMFMGRISQDSFLNEATYLLLNLKSLQLLHIDTENFPAVKVKQLTAAPWESNAEEWLALHLRSEVGVNTLE